ncbi:hypothetical protein D3C81_1665820 [compost metagenome]
MENMIRRLGLCAFSAVNRLTTSRALASLVAGSQAHSRLLLMSRNEKLMWVSCLALAGVMLDTGNGTTEVSDSV